VVTPREHAKRGSQVALAIPGVRNRSALIARGVVGDFRAPDVARFGFTPLYLRFVDVYDAVEILVGVLSRDSPRPRLRVRNPVT